MSQLPGQPAQGEESVDPALVSAAERLRVGEGEPGHQAAGGLPQGVAAHKITPICHRFVASTNNIQIFVYMFIFMFIISN